MTVLSAPKKALATRSKENTYTANKMVVAANKKSHVTEEDLQRLESLGEIADRWIICIVVLL